MKKVMLLFLVFILSSFVFAQNSEGVGERTQVQEQLREHVDELLATGTVTGERLQERKQLKDEAISNMRERLRDGQEIEMTDKKLVLRRLNEEMIELKAEKANVRTRLELNNEGNLSQLKTRLSNGRNAEIKIMPETASERALQRLRLKNCNESQNCTIELKEVGEGNKTRAAYEVKAKKTFKILGFIKNHEEISTQIDAETGEEIQTRRPWWSWMATESEE